MWREIGAFLDILIPLLGGIYCILYFKKYIKPKFKNEEHKEKYEAYINRNGKKMSWLGFFLIIISLINLAFRFG